MKHHPYVTRQLRTCGQCQVTYLPRAGGQRYCTTACAKKHQSDAAKARYAAGKGSR